MSTICRERYSPAAFFYAPEGFGLLPSGMLCCFVHTQTYPKRGRPIPMSRLPAVRDGTLLAAVQTSPVHVGAAEWFAWLDEARSFTFAGKAGTFTARHEERSGHHFWYAYRQRDGVLRKTYLGRSADLTAQRLEQAAQTLANTSASR